MELSESQKRILSQWVDAHAYLLKPCLVCGTEDGFDRGDLIAPPLVDAYGKVIPGQFAEPVITFACGHCGYVLAFRAKRIGLV